MVNAESNTKGAKISRSIKTSPCGLVVMTLAWKARGPGSIKCGGEFIFIHLYIYISV